MLTAQRWIGDTLGNRRLGPSDLCQIACGCENQGLRVLLQWSLSGCQPASQPACLPVWIVTAG